jgi:lipid-A-disaccharide synthase
VFLLPVVTLVVSAVQFLVSAGEASGDLYASGVVNYLRQMLPGTSFYGCAGPRLQSEGVNPVVDASRLAVVGLAEVVRHLPRIYGEYQKLLRAASRNRPDAALLTDSPDFHLRVARRLKDMGVPVFYLVAPQVWAWRQGRVRTLRKLVDKLFCLFPFEERWFRERGVDALYIGHPLASVVRKSTTRSEFLDRNGLAAGQRTIVLLPGSRIGEAARHLPILFGAVRELRRKLPLSVLWATPKGFGASELLEKFREPIQSLSIKVLEDQTWDCIGHSDLALAASGTVTVEAAILGTPMVTFYKVSPLSWYGARHLVKVPFLSMVNLIADRQVVPELIQNAMTPESIATEAASLLSNERKASDMRTGLASVRAALTGSGDPFETAASAILASIHPARMAGVC